MVKTENLKTQFKDYVSLCIWGDGPGRPFDNAYLLIEKKMDIENNTLYLFFGNNEKCTIENPSEITMNNGLFSMKTADKIIWEFYYYGKPQTNETLCNIEYTLINPNRVHIVENNNFWKRDELLDVLNKKALEIIQ